MILYVNELNEIKDVNETSYKNLIPLEIIDDEENPFRKWSVAKICCYKVQVEDSRIVSFTPYVDSRIIEHIDKLSINVEANTSDIIDNQLATVDVYEKTLVTDENVTELELALTEIYELMLG